MENSLAEVKETKYCIIVKTKGLLEKRRILAHLPHNLSGFDIRFSNVIAEENEEGQMTYRSRERLKLTELKDNNIRIECEDSGFFLCACAFLNDASMEFYSDSYISYLVEEYKTVNLDNIDEQLEEIELFYCSGPINESLFTST